MTRWLARIALALIAAGGCFGLYELPVPKGGASHVWPVHSHHILLVFGMAMVWIVVVAALIVVAFIIVYTLWEIATEKP